MHERAVITGDVIGSTAIDKNKWLPKLTEALGALGNASKDWDVFRGDSFQMITEPAEAFSSAVYIKATLKTIKNIDVRIAIGLGKIDKVNASEDIRTASGEAYIRSGQLLEKLKPAKTNLAIHTDSTELDETINLVFKLLLNFMDHWTPVEAEMVKISLANRDDTQYDLASMLKKRQSTLSEALKRAKYASILDVDRYFRKHINR